MPRSDDVYQLPQNLPVPINDGATDHLRGIALPEIPLLSTSGEWVSLRQASFESRTIVYCYPRTGRPDQEPPPGWNEIPGARGCTPQACAFRDRRAQLSKWGVGVFGLSAQDSAYQQELVQRLHLPFEVLSDVNYRLTAAMRLPTFDVGEMRLLKRFTLVLSQGVVEKVFYPVFPPDQNAAEVLRWLAEGSPTR